MNSKVFHKSAPNQGSWAPSLPKLEMKLKIRMKIIHKEKKNQTGFVA
jgi:hypothetical protein